MNCAQGVLRKKKYKKLHVLEIKCLKEFAYVGYTVFKGPPREVEARGSVLSIS